MRFFLKNLIFSLFIQFFLVSSNTIFASSDNAMLPSLEAVYKDWKVFTIEQNGQNVCYAVSTPKSLSGNHTDDREPYIMVAFFGKVRQEVSISTGYFYRPNSIVSVSIDGEQERFVAEGETLAWPEKKNSDKMIIKKMLDGFKFIVFAESNSSTYSVDTYSLSGFKKAYNKIKELCGGIL